MKIFFQGVIPDSTAKKKVLELGYNQEYILLIHIKGNGWGMEWMQVWIQSLSLSDLSWTKDLI